MQKSECCRVGVLEVRGFLGDPRKLCFLAAFGFDEPEMELSVRDPNTPEKYAVSEADWERAESTLAASLEGHGLAYESVEARRSSTARR
jgi:threonyl-tRNA synthetase